MREKLWRVRQQRSRNTAAWMQIAFRITITAPRNSYGQIEDQKVGGAGGIINFVLPDWRNASTEEEKAKGGSCCSYDSENQVQAETEQKERTAADVIRKGTQHCTNDQTQHAHTG